MKIFCTLLACGVAAVASAEAPTIFEARDVYQMGQKIGHALVARGARADGVRWFYSQDVITPGRGRVGGQGTLESFSAPDGTPLSATYRWTGAGVERVTELRNEGARLTLVETTRASGKGDQVRRAVIPVAPGEMVQFSQFNPVDVPFPSGAPSVPLTIVEPAAFTTVRSELRLLKLQAKVTPSGQLRGAECLYRLSTANSFSEIQVDSEGRFRSMENSEHLGMISTKLKEDESVFLKEVEARLSKV